MKKNLCGAALAEYAVILAVVLVGAVVSLSLIADRSAAVFSDASVEVSKAVPETE